MTASILLSITLHFDKLEFRQQLALLGIAGDRDSLSLHFMQHFSVATRGCPNTHRRMHSGASPLSRVTVRISLNDTCLER